MIDINAVYASNKCGKFIITEYINCYKIKIKFISTKFETYSNSSNIKEGKVKDYTLRNVQDIATVGGVQYSKKHNKLAYDTWQSMIKRCYSLQYIQHNPSYINCIVSDEWLNFQNFCPWFLINFKPGYHLDKDLKVIDNKIYSKDTCLMIPAWLNTALCYKNKTRVDKTYNNKFKPVISYKDKNYYGKVTSNKNKALYQSALMKDVKLTLIYLDPILPKELKPYIYKLIQKQKGEIYNVKSQ